MVIYYNSIIETVKPKQNKMYIADELEETFSNYNWSMIKREEDHIIFKKNTNNYDYFDIQIGSKINISVPLIHSRFQYYTRFDLDSVDYLAYIKNHLDNYEREKARN
jgi:hypothetical protein